MKKVVVDKKMAVEKKKTEVATKMTETKMTETRATKMAECDVCHEMFETPTLAIQVRWNWK